MGKTGYLDILPKLAGLLVVRAAVVCEVSVRKDEAVLMAFLETANPLQIQPDGELRPEVLAWDLGSGIPSDFIGYAVRRGPRGA